MNKIFIVGLVIALALGIVGIFTPKYIPPVVETLGGLVHIARESFSQGISGNLVTGNGVLALGITASASLTAAQLCDYGLITLDPYGTSAGLSEDGASLSLATSATMIKNCLPNVGDSKTIIFENVATASSRNFEFTTYNAAENDYELFLNGGTALSSDFTELQIVRAIHTTGATVSYQVIESTGD